MNTKKLNNLTEAIEYCKKNNEELEIKVNFDYEGYDNTTSPAIAILTIDYDGDVGTHYHQVDNEESDGEIGKEKINDTFFPYDVKENEIAYYETAYEYAKHADVSIFYFNGYRDEKSFVFEFTLADEAEICDNEKIKDGKNYVQINWGEYEISYILEKAIHDELFGIYVARQEEEIKDCDEKRYFDFKANAFVYESEESAKKDL